MQLWRPWSEELLFTLNSPGIVLFCKPANPVFQAARWPSNFSDPKSPVQFYTSFGPKCFISDITPASASGSKWNNWSTRVTKTFPMKRPWSALATVRSLTYESPFEKSFFSLTNPGLSQMHDGATCPKGTKTKMVYYCHNIVFARWRVWTSFGEFLPVCGTRFRDSQLQVIVALFFSGNIKSAKCRDSIGTNWLGCKMSVLQILMWLDQKSTSAFYCSMYQGFVTQCAQLEWCRPAGFTDFCL